MDEVVPSMVGFFTLVVRRKHAEGSRFCKYPNTSQWPVGGRERVGSAVPEMEERESFVGVAKNVFEIM